MEDEPSGERDAEPPHERERPRPAYVDPKEEAWNLAVSRQPQEAYSRLLEQDSREPGSWDTALRLYWLLAVRSDLDAVRSRHDWLAAALTRSRLTGPAAELYRRELATNPRKVLLEPYDRLLEVEAAGGNLLWVARERLGAAGSNRAWLVMNNDVRTLSERVGSLDEVAWLSYLVAVLSHAEFDQPAPLYQRCTSLVAGLKHLELRESWAFDQVEEHQQQVSVWRAASGLPDPVRDVVRSAWVCTAEGCKGAVRKAAAWAANDPAAALAQFNNAASLSRDHQQIIAAFQRVLDERLPPRSGDYPPELIRGLVREFLFKHGRGNYAGMRPELLLMLVREAIDPQEMIAAALVDSTLGPRALVGHVGTDSLLRLVWRIASARV